MKLLQPASLPVCGFGFAEFCSAKLQEHFPGVWGKAPNSENQNALRFGSAPLRGRTKRLDRTKQPWYVYFISRRFAAEA
jgi:hypothetical protein